MHNALKRFALLAALPALLFLSACDRHDHDHDEHGDIARVEIVARDGSDTVLATYTRGSGWNPATLPTLTVSNDPATNFGRAAYTVRIYDNANNQLVTRSPRNPDGTRTCGEFSARYVVRSGNQFIYDPGTSSSTNVSSITVNVGGAEREVFHCDHLYVFPRAAGTAQIAFLLWHGDHSDGSTTPIALPVVAGSSSASN